MVWSEKLHIIEDIITVVNVKKDKVYYNDNLLTPPSTYVYYKLNKPLSEYKNRKCGCGGNLIYSKKSRYE